jgi:hypothetical protein
MRAISLAIPDRVFLLATEPTVRLDQIPQRLESSHGVGVLALPIL